MLRWLILSLALAPAAAMALGDPEAGENKAAVCAACHGMDGNSTVPVWPKIAGQHIDYFAHQMILIRERIRDVPEMYPMVMNLTDQDIYDIAAWYNQQSVSPGVADEALVPLGRKVYHGGNYETGLPACMACHGPAGEGIPGAHYPKLRGQHAAHTADRLRRYRAGETNNDDPHSRIMVAVSVMLTDEEIEAVSSYIEGLHWAD